MRFSDLCNMESNDPVEAWRIVTDIESPGEFAIAVDYAMEHSLFPTEFAAQWRGEASEAPRKFWVNPIDGTEMAWIPPGKFLASSPRRSLTCEGFFLARFPITNAQFHRFIEATGYQPAENDPTRENFLKHWLEGRPAPEDEPCPVVWVSFVDAWQYCQWARLTLPNEWLWEKAARGTDGRTFPWGEASPMINTYQRHSFANVKTKRLGPVGSFAHGRTPYGCEDLVGNVSEWCQFSELAPLSSPSESSAPSPQSFVSTYVPQKTIQFDPKSLNYLTTFAAVRGSAFLRKQQSAMGAAHRRRLAIGRRNKWVGFRPAFYPPANRET